MAESYILVIGEGVKDYNSIREYLEFAYHLERHQSNVQILLPEKFKEIPSSGVDIQLSNDNDELAVQEYLKSYNFKNISYISNSTVQQELNKSTKKNLDIEIKDVPVVIKSNKEDSFEKVIISGDEIPDFNKRYRETSVAAYQALSQLFPQLLTSRDYILITIGSILGLVAALQNFVFGGGYAMCFAAKIAEKHNIKLSDDDLKIIKYVFASIAGIVNACINGRTVKYATEVLQEPFKNAHGWQYAKQGIILFLKLCGAFLPAFPGLKIIQDAYNKLWGEESWGPSATSAMEGVGTGVNAGMMVRGVKNFVNYSQDKTRQIAYWAITNKNSYAATMFGAQNRANAVAVRYALLSNVNNILPSNLKFDNEALKQLSEGKNYKNTGTKLVVNGVTLLLIGLAWGYAYGAYANSAKETAKESIDDFEKDHPKTHIPELMSSIYSYLCLVMAVGSKGAMFTRSIDLSTEYYFDRYLSEPYIDLSKDETRTEKFLGITKDLVAALFGVYGLTGADGLVETYYFTPESAKEDKNGCPSNQSLKNYTLSTLIATGGAGIFNIKDVSDTLDGMNSTKDTLYRKWLKKAKGDFSEINKSKYGKDNSQFLLRSMVLITKKGDSETLNSYVQSRISEEERSLVNEESERIQQSAESNPELNGQFEVNSNFISFKDTLEEISYCTNIEYNQFLSQNVGDELFLNIKNIINTGVDLIRELKLEQVNESEKILN